MARAININKLDLKGNHKKCSDKNCYTSENEAQKVADEQEALNWNSNLKLKTYRCHLCNSWHLTRNRLNDF